MGGVVFELDRFELSARSGCLLEGRWFGVRGRRFMRPTLTLTGDGRATRLLADLTHKPWGPEEGQPWEAVFPGELGDGEPARAELTVAPDITIALPVPDGAAGTAEKRAGGGMETLSREIAETQREIRQSRRALEAAQAETLRTAAQRDALVAELEDLRRAREQTEQELDQTAAEREAALQAHNAAIEAGNSARSALEHGLAERDAAVAARETAMAERHAALAARDRAVAERDASTAARGTAESERDAALATRDAALAARDEAISARDVALAARDAAASERDTAISARQQAVAERDAMNSAIERLRSELAEEKMARGAALVMSRATQAQHAGSYPPRLTGAVATIVVLMIVVVVLIVVGVV